MRTRIGQYHTLKAGDLYKGIPIKSTSKITGAQCPTKAYYDSGQTIQNTDKVLRMVLENGFIHYVKLG